jgi:monoterpene epsilon-lactone hydrolase
MHTFAKSIKLIATGVTLFSGCLLNAQLSKQASPSDSAKPAQITVTEDGTVDLPAVQVPMSRFLSPEGKAYVNYHLHANLAPPAPDVAKGVPALIAPYIDRQKALFAVDQEDAQFNGVHAYVFTPREGVSASNKHRVLIDLHGGGFSGCWPACAELESRPIAGSGRIKVVSVDYREQPEFKHPAASEDVAKVYSELLKTYKPSEIGIYGCSAGGMLTAMSIAWFQAHNLPRPGAIGILCAGAGAFGGDSAFTSTMLGEARIIPAMTGTDALRRGYFSDADPNDPLVAPLVSKDVLAKFPPTLLVTGTRSMEMSGAVFTHSQLVKNGIDAELHVWEGMFHGFFYNPDVPESRECYDVIVNFFNKHLASR